MANSFVKAWKYLMALFGSKVEEHADPKVQIQQAIEESQRQHQALVQQAAAVIGNQRQLEMKLSRKLSEVEKLQASTRQALTLADRARGAGDGQRAQEFDEAAQEFATQLVSAEQGMEDLKTLHDQSLTAAERARKAVEDNARLLKQHLAERTKLLNQLEQAKMQETIAHSLESMSELAAPGNVPSLDDVRDKIERRYAAALGRADLAQSTAEGRMVEVERSTLDMAGSSRLEEIRSSMEKEKLGAAPERAAVESGKTTESGAAAEESGGTAGQDSGAAGAAKVDEIRASVAKERDNDSTAG